MRLDGGDLENEVYNKSYSIRVAFFYGCVVKKIIKNNGL